MFNYWMMANRSKFERESGSAHAFDGKNQFSLVPEIHKPHAEQGPVAFFV
jgi:hypothetical protein